MIMQCGDLGSIYPGRVAMQCGDLGSNEGDVLILRITFIYFPPILAYFTYMGICHIHYNYIDQVKADQ